MENIFLNFPDTNNGVMSGGSHKVFRLGAFAFLRPPSLKGTLLILVARIDLPKVQELLGVLLVNCPGRDFDGVHIVWFLVPE